LNFHPFGIWETDECKTFYGPLNPEYVSHTIFNRPCATTFQAQCYSLKSVMKMFGHSKIDLLKMDIEGAEVAVIRNMLGEKIHPTVLCVEIDNGQEKQTLVEEILNSGYIKIHSFGITEKFTFVKAP